MKPDQPVALACLVVLGALVTAALVWAAMAALAAFLDALAWGLGILAQL